MRLCTEANISKAHFSTSLVRGLSILAAFTPEDPALGITELAQRVELHKSTTHRYVTTLEMLGYLQQDPETRKYRLGIRVVDLGLAALNGIELRQLARPELEALAERTGHSVNISVLDGPEVVYIERVRKYRILDLALQVGSRLPAYCTSMGKVLLAHLPPSELEDVLKKTSFEPRGPNTITSVEDLKRELETVRRQGFAVNNEELANGLRSVAAPIRRYDGQTIAALNLSVHASMVTLDELTGALASQVIEACRRISEWLGYRSQTEADGWEES